MIPLQQVDQVIPVTALKQGLGQCPDLVRTDPALQEGDLLGTGDLEALTVFDDGSGLRVIRGGNWVFDPGSLRSASRGTPSASTRIYKIRFIGFRCARSAKK